MKKNVQKLFFRESLLLWNEYDNDRPMPWKGEKDPYKIWISEIILQQTRVAQGLEYYKRFIHKFPTIQYLAKAPEKQVFKLWEGLGYYSRCKNLISTAKYISKELMGIFPDNYADLIKLKGVGKYTASAIASFAYALPYAVVDGNVFRVLSRYFGIETPIDSNEGKKYFTEIANNLLDNENPGVYNQAIMDFGAVVCKPLLPLCNGCPLQSQCKAYKNNLVKILPIKEKFILRKERWFYYFIIELNNTIYIKKRKKKDIWQNLYEFVIIEKNKDTNFSTQKKINDILKESKITLSNFQIVSISPVSKQQ